MRLNETPYKTFEERCRFARAAGKRYAPIVRTLLADSTTPVLAYRALTEGKQRGALLESVNQGEHVGRYSIVAVSPYATFTSTGGRSKAELPDGVVVVGDAPLSHLTELLEIFSPVPVPELDCFTGGAVGYFGYEANLLIEPTIPRHEVDDLHVPDIFQNFFRNVVVFDHVKQEMHLVTNVSWEPGEEYRAYEDAQVALDAMEDCIASASYTPEHSAIEPAPVASTMGKREYCDMVCRAKEYVAEGDVFQVVLSQRFSRPFSGSSLDFYRILRRTNPSPYMFHITMDDEFVLVGASPEVMVRITGRKMLIRPIAGTRKRGGNDEEDAKIADELAADEKEQAEHRMLVDLARNDVGRYCVPGSVVPEEVMRVEYYSHVMHLVSSVTGTLRDGVPAMEAIVGSLPAGTLSGAPKVRAMQLIPQFEPTCRGPYGGAIGYFTDTRSDSCIGIRCALIKAGTMYWQSGGGIVHDSDPEAEYEESVAKARAILVAIRTMERRK